MTGRSGRPGSKLYYGLTPAERVRLKFACLIEDREPDWMVHHLVPDIDRDECNRLLAEMNSIFRYLGPLAVELQCRVKTLLMEWVALEANVRWGIERELLRKKLRRGELPIPSGPSDPFKVIPGLTSSGASLDEDHLTPGDHLILEMREDLLTTTPAFHARLLAIESAYDSCRRSFDGLDLDEPHLLDVMQEIRSDILFLQANSALLLGEEIVLSTAPDPDYLAEIDHLRERERKKTGY